MAQVLSNQQSSLTGPTMYYDLWVSEASRTGTTVTLNYEMHVRLATAQSFSGTNVNFNAIINANGTPYEFNFKSSSESWTGTATHTFTGQFTVSASGSTTLIPITFRTYSYGYSSSAGGTLYETTCSSLAISVGAPTFSMSASSVTGGGSISVSYTAITGQTYKFALVGATSGKTYQSASATHSWSGTTTENWASNIPTRTSEKVNVICYTYSGSTLIDTQTLSFTYNVKSYSLGVNTTLTGVNLFASKYLQNYSKVSFSNTATTYQGATVTYSTNIGGYSYGGASGTSYVLGTSGTVNITVTATDSRGKTGTITKSISVVAYSQPTISSVLPTNSNGTITAKITFSYSSVGGSNGITLSIKVDNTSAGSVSNVSSPYTITASGSYPDTATHTLIATITDTIGNTNTKNIIVPTVEVPLDINYSGKGVAIGKVSEGTNGLFEVGWDTNIDGDIDISGNVSRKSGTGTITGYNLDGNATSADYLSTYKVTEDSNLLCLQKIYNSLPKGIGTAVRLQHGSYSMAFGWFLNEREFANAYGGWFISDYSTPVWVGVRNGAWLTAEFITTNNSCTLVYDGSTTGSISVSSSEYKYLIVIAKISGNSIPHQFVVAPVGEFNTSNVAGSPTISWNGSTLKRASGATNSVVFVKVYGVK